MECCAVPVGWIYPEVSWNFGESVYISTLSDKNSADMAISMTFTDLLKFHDFLMIYIYIYIYIDIDIISHSIPGKVGLIYPYLDIFLFSFLDLIASHSILHSYFFFIISHHIPSIVGKDDSFLGYITIKTPVRHHFMVLSSWLLVTFLFLSNNYCQLALIAFTYQLLSRLINNSYSP